MSAEVFYRAMGLSGYWVVDVWESQTGVIQVLVEPPRDSLRCHGCRSREVHVHERKTRTWKDVPYGAQMVNIVMESPRVRCQNCGKKTWHQPKFAEGQRRHTKHLEEHVSRWLSRITIQDAVLAFGLSWDTVAEIDRRRLKKLTRPELKGLKRLAIDELYVGKKHRFLTLVHDLDTRAVLSVSKGRGVAALRGFFGRLERSGAEKLAGTFIASISTVTTIKRFHN